MNDGALERPEGSPTRRPSDRHTWIFRGLALLLLLIAGRGWDKSISERGNDLTIYLESAELALAGENPLEPEGSIYLPFFDCLLAPLALFPRPVFAAIWQLASWACAVWALATLARLVDPGRRHPWLLWATPLLTLRLWDSNFSYGQANAFTFAALVGALALILRGRDRRAGALIGLAAAFKVLPAIAFLLLLARRSWGALAAGVGVLAGLSLVVPPLFLGWSGSVEAHRQWVEDVSGPYVIGGEIVIEKHGMAAGHSLLASAYRTLGNTPVTRNDMAKRASLAEWDLDHVHLLVRGLILIHLVLVGWVLFRRERSRAATVETWALVLCTALVCGPLIHKAHMSWSTAGFAVLLVAVAEARGPAATLRVAVPLALAAILIGVTTPLFFGTELVRELVTRNTLTLGLECLWIGVLLKAWPRAQRASEA
ncbi:MAG: glycosyltransferase family 87 protein [Planctomycetota bacterium]